MKLTYLGHSGMRIRGERTSLIFDYYTGANPLKADGGIPPEHQLYVFISHSHHDHCNPAVAGYRAVHPNTLLIAAEEARFRLRRFGADDDLITLRMGERYEDAHIKVWAFGSTDLGVSFLVQCEDKLIFHAGDLNDWHWREDPETSPMRSARYTAHFEKELQRIAQAAPLKTRRLDLAMFPIDPRLGTEFGDGAAKFLKTMHPKVFAPMHFWDDYGLQERFLQQYGILEDIRYLYWQRPGQTEEF